MELSNLDKPAKNVSKSAGRHRGKYLELGPGARQQRGDPNIASYYVWYLWIGL